MGASQSVRRTDRINLLDLGSYKYPVRRLCNGVDQCSEYQRMVKERAEIELKYAITLRDWAEKWEKIIAKGPENGTVKEVWQSHMKEARDVARFHDNCSQRIREEVIPHIKKWKHENYHKTKLHFNLKEISRAKKGFWRAQKPWKRKSKQVNSYKKAYHKACKMYDRRRQAVTDMATGNNPDPDDTRLAKRREKMRKAESAYNGSLRELLMPRYRDVYKNDMYMEFRKCQEAEGNRIKNLLETIHKYKEAVDLTNQRMDYIYQEMLDTISQVNVEEHLQIYSDTFGIDMDYAWPKFEEYNPRSQEPQSVNDNRQPTAPIAPPLDDPPPVMDQPPNYNDIT